MGQERKRETSRKRAGEQTIQTENYFKAGARELLMTGQRQKKGTNNSRAAERNSYQLSPPLLSLPSLHPIVSVAKPTPHYGSLGLL